MKKTDIWMPLYIGDYLADTSHLNAEQSGCYLHWLMHYWRQGALPDSLTVLIRIGKLDATSNTTSNATSIAQALLTEFFQLEDDGRWHQKRIDLEMAKWNEKQRKAQEKAILAAKSRWNRGDATSIQ